MSWNLNARRVACDAQARAIADLVPDVVAFQELTPASWATLRESLTTAGMPHSLATTTAPVDGARPARFVGIISRWPLALCAQPAAPRPELIVCAVAHSPFGAVEVLAVHIPTWSNGRLPKVETEEAVALRVREAQDPLILLGDFNAPKAELEDGTVVAFTPRRDERAHAAELSLTGPALAAAGLRDVYRAVNGYGVSDSSWYWKNRGRTGGFRLDHLFASDRLRPMACWYEHTLRESGLSDHAPIVADLEITPWR